MLEPIFSRFMRDRPGLARLTLALVGAVLVTGGLMLAAPAAGAQVPIDQSQSHDILKEDGTTRIGIIFVDRVSNASKKYVEHWVMFDNYTYPSRIRPSASSYRSAEDFLARVPWGPGYSYARWDVVEQSALPGR